MRALAIKYWKLLTTRRVEFAYVDNEDKDEDEDEDKDENENEDEDENRWREDERRER